MMRAAAVRAAGKTLARTHYYAKQKKKNNKEGQWSSLITTAAAATVPPSALECHDKKYDHCSSCVEQKHMLPLSNRKIAAYEAWWRRAASSSAPSYEAAAETTGQEFKFSPMAEYERRIASGDVHPGDKFQESTVNALQDLYDELWRKSDDIGLDSRLPVPQSYSRSAGGWLWQRLMRRSSPASPRGLYMYGGVGTGKTMLMDMFYEQLPKTWRKRRIHFHDFMINIHTRLQRSRGMTDPLEVVAEDIVEESILLCIDEFMVTDVADALILNRLFDHLFKQGLVLVSTSNRAPDQLYEGGLQRDLFLPFIARLKDRCVIHKIDSATDYRKLAAAVAGHYFTGPGASELLQMKFQSLIQDEKAVPTTVEVVMGRRLKVPLSAAGCAFFQFHELCDMPLGAADYIGLFQSFHTLALDGVPVFGSHNRSSAYRFVTLVDVMYEHRARFLCSAEAPALELFAKVVTIRDAPRRKNSRSSHSDQADLLVDNELGFAKDRTCSRLTEMQGAEYLEDHAAVHLTKTNSMT
ncbi:hypothetical protein BDL97_07G070100 [Sphagnum fallax]|nr:hypothetical protein BDL97_07G070100 [Sphagnum fallax]